MARAGYTVEAWEGLPECGATPYCVVASLATGAERPFMLRVFSVGAVAGPVGLQLSGTEGSYPADRLAVTVPVSFHVIVNDDGGSVEVPTDPEPTDPTDPITPTDPTDPGSPTDPGGPGTPTEPTDPGTPADPGTPTGPSGPRYDWSDPEEPTPPRQPKPRPAPSSGKSSSGSVDVFGLMMLGVLAGGLSRRKRRSV